MRLLPSHYFWTTLKRWKWKCIRSVMSDSVFPWTLGHQASLSMEFSRQEYWSGLPLPSPGHLPEPGIEPWVSRMAGRFLTIWDIRKAHVKRWVTSQRMRIITRIKLEEICFLLKNQYKSIIKIPTWVDVSLSRISNQFE